MSETNETKISAVTLMITALGKLTNVEARLRFAGDTTQANQVQAKHDELRDAIDRLRAKIAQDWTGDLEPLEDGLRKINAKVQASIRDIQRNINVAGNVVKVLGQVEQVVKLANGLMA